MKVSEVEVVSGADGQVAKALLAVCSECESDTWQVFQLVGQRHFHLQCNKCGVSFCPQEVPCGT